MRIVFPALFVLVVFAPVPSPAEDKGIEFFERQVRPLLVKHCYECHSSRAQELKGGLALDYKKGWATGGDSGPAIVPGKVEDSLLVKAVRYEDYEMPPKGKLDQAEIEVLEKWVGMGAPDPRDEQTTKSAAKTFDWERARQFWSFQQPRATVAPQVSDENWPRGDIDRYVLAELDKNHLVPSGDTDWRTWIRRATFDLIGLPPTPEQVERFQAAAARNPQPAMEDAVDRLLQSLNFGEHWGRHWLDVARYADSNGGDFNATFHNAWRYRNYVIQSMNDDKPFDQFIRQQIAGDLLPYDSDEQRTANLTATGFLMIGAKMLSERDKAKLKMDIVDEQIDTVGRAFMALTLGCARCHDHKFDPIPTEDYYALAGIFHSTKTVEGEFQQYVSKWTLVDLPVSPDRVAAVKEHEQRTKELSEAIAKAKQELKGTEDQLARLTSHNAGLVFDDTAAILEGEWKPSTYSPNFVGKGYLHDDNQGKGEKSVTFAPKLPKAALYEVQLSYTGGSGRASDVPVTVQHADGTTQLMINQKMPPPVENLFLSLGRFRFAEEGNAAVTISNKGTLGHVIVDAVRFIETDEKGQPVVAQTDETKEESETLGREVEDRKQRIVELESTLKGLKEQAPPPLPQALAAVDSNDIDDCAICIRGEHKNRGPQIPRGFLRVAAAGPSPAISGSESGRRELADRIASPENPLTSRVIVNRIWSHLLGEGIVRSVDNFGQLGERPTHPGLLDRLAVDFMNDGWSIKRTIRRIVLSRTYAMSSEHDPGMWQADPENRLLWRFNRRRLPAESIRDSLLLLSGQLDSTPGESPVGHLGKLVNDNSPQASNYEQTETKKRSVYMPIIRNELPPVLTVFDFADPDLSTGKRSVTNVPAQALLLMNSPFVMDCCRQVARNLLEDHSLADQDRIDRIYESILSRRPTEVEVQRALDYIASESESDESVWAQFVQVIFASTEFRILN